MNIPKVYVDSTRFIIDDGKVSCASNQKTSGGKLACASLLKPLYMWSAAHLEPYKYEEEKWLKLAEQATTTSSNNATNAIWDSLGAATILHKLNELTQAEYTTSSSLTYGSVEVNSTMVAHSYASLLMASAHDTPAAKIVAWMKQVKSDQTFGLRDEIDIFYSGLLIGVGVKCGWYVDQADCRLRTHAVIFAELDASTTLGFVILTSVLVTRCIVNDYLSEYETGQEVLGIHEKISGKLLREELRALLNK